MQSKDPPNRLDYAPPPPWHRRRVSRWIGAAIVVVLLGLILLKIGPVAWRRIQLAYLMQRCMQYTAPADRIVLTVRQPSSSPAVPQEWSKLYTMLSPPGMSSAGTLFLHERISPSGNRRLVAVDAQTGANSGAILIPRVVRPGSLMQEPSDSIDPKTKFIVVPQAAIVHAGQPDPADGSHFTLRLVIKSHEQILDGWLRDDERVVIEPRNAPDSSSTRPLP